MLTNTPGAPITTGEAISALRRQHARRVRIASQYRTNWQHRGPLTIPFDDARATAALLLAEAADSRRDLVAAKAGQLTEWNGRPVR